MNATKQSSIGRQWVCVFCSSASAEIGVHERASSHGHGLIKRPVADAVREFLNAMRHNVRAPENNAPVKLEPLLCEILKRNCLFQPFPMSSRSIEDESRSSGERFVDERRFEPSRFR